MSSEDQKVSEADHKADGGEASRRARVPTSELDERLAAVEARMSDLDARERALAEREAQFEKRAALAPREREAQFATRSRAADESARLERLPMDYFAPTSQLTVPEDDQYYYRWIRESVNGQRDAANVQRRLKEGFTRVLLDDLPEDFIVDEDERGDGFARSQGLILMRMPAERKRAIDAYWDQKSVERSESADELQGIARRDYVREDRGSRSLTGAEAQQALSHMSRN